MAVGSTLKQPSSDASSRLLVDAKPAEFTRDGLLDMLFSGSFERITFRYVALDGELRELRFPVTDRRRAERVLACGERVDGSSLFKGLVDVGASDLCVVPRYSTAFVDPFDPAGLTVLCRFVDADGAPAAFSPDVVVERAARSLSDHTGLAARVLVELEFFLLGEPGAGRCHPSPEGAYQSGTPGMSYGHVVDEMVECITRVVAGAVKYAHAEAGFVAALPPEHGELAGRCGEQHEIELLSRPLPEMADLVALSRWIIRTVAHRHGLRATFAPMVAHDVPGNGCHCHLELERDGASVMTDERGQLSETSRRLIGGLLTHAASMAAFGNTARTSYLRLAAGREAPGHPYWSQADRGALVRVPLGWRSGADLARVVNPGEPRPYSGAGNRQTVEFRLPDGSARPHLLLAGLAAAAEWGLTQREAEEVTAATHVCGASADDGKPGRGAAQQLLPAVLPVSCTEAGLRLKSDRRLYERRGVFPAALIDSLAEDLERKDAADGDVAGLDEAERRRREARLMGEDVLRF